MDFTTPAGENLIDRLTVVGQPTPRIDGPLKVTGTAPYAYEQNGVASGIAYGWIVGAAIGKGRVTAVDTSQAEAAPGVVTVLSTLDYEPSGIPFRQTANLFGGAEVAHYNQAVALVVADTFEAARAASACST